jgi:hypothetical protein
MEQQINERLIKVSSRLPYSGEIQLGEDITITFARGETFILNCVKTEDMDNQDGTINRIYTLKWLGE